MIGKGRKNMAKGKHWVGHAKQKIGRVLRTASNYRLSRLDRAYERSEARDSFLIDRTAELAALHEMLERRNIVEIRQFVQQSKGIFTTEEQQRLLAQSNPELRRTLKKYVREVHTGSSRIADRHHMQGMAMLKKQKRIRTRHQTGWIGKLINWLEK